MEAPRDENHVPAVLFESASNPGTVLTGKIDESTGQILVTETDGGVVGPVSSTDNAIVRWDGTSGGTIQNSLVIVSDTGALSGITNIVSSGTWAGTNVIASGFINAASYEVNSVNGASGSFTTVDSKTVTVVGGIITSIV